MTPSQILAMREKYKAETPDHVLSEANDRLIDDVILRAAIDADFEAVRDGMEVSRG